MGLCYTLIDMRVRMIEDILSKKRKVNEVAEIMGVSRKTIHQWKCKYKYHGPAWLVPRKPWPKKGTPWNRTKKEIEDTVIELARLHKKDWPKKLQMILYDEYWIKLDSTTVWRILKRRHTRYHEEYVRPKRAPKLYVLDTPWRELQVDTSFPFWRHRKVVIYSAIDDCTRKVYSKAYKRHTLSSTKKFMKELIERCPFQIKRIRTDQGREFSRTITKYLHRKWVEHVKNEAYHPEHNGKVERYHRTMKQEEISRWPYLISIHEANYMLRQRTAYYNTKRRHTGLWMNWMTPDQKLKNVTLILQ